MVGSLSGVQGAEYMMKEPYLFGIRHLSPSGAWHLRKFLDEKRPRLVMIEGPSDFTDRLCDILRPETKPPIAVLAYTKDTPVHTILYPFAEYSPEYQAILWAFENEALCRFIDLPSNVFLALSEIEHEPKGEDNSFDVYEKLDQQAGEGGHETFWERTLEHTISDGAYHAGANTFGRELRNITMGLEDDWARNLVREAYMRRQIEDAISHGFKPEEIVVVTGSYHVEGIKTCSAMTDEELAALPKKDSSLTWMPYSYYRLSSRSGYGAGNKAPAYYGILWEALCQQDLTIASRSYLSRIAVWQRAHGTVVSPAEVIEAVRLANALAAMRGSAIPALYDLRDAAITCLGHGSFASISLAVADTEIGTAIGVLAEGVSRTSIQEDFYRELKLLKLEKYRDLAAQDLLLDLRENRMVKGEKAAFLDLERSFFLHRLRVLFISFAKHREVNQERATWSESWILQWTPEAEIELVESALQGDTIIQAAAFKMKEQVEDNTDISKIAAVIEDAFYCGMPSAVVYATKALQAAAVDAAGVNELAACAHRLSIVIQYGSIRKLDSSPLEPILQQLFFRSCLILAGSCVCDDNASKMITEVMEQLNAAQLAHDFLEEDGWISVLWEIVRRDDLNTRCSGFAAAVLLERGIMDADVLSLEVGRRLSKGVPADLGAGWFEGLALKNRYALTARLSLWRSLSDYLDDLDEEEFKRALVFLRRAFADFSAREKNAIAENLGEIWNLNGEEVSEAVNAPLTVESMAVLEELEDFDFDDI